MENFHPNADATEQTEDNRFVAAELRAELLRVRDAHYPSRLARNGARLTALEDVMLELLKQAWRWHA